MEWTNEITLEFLKLYEAEPAIWDPKDENHRNRNNVFDGWSRIRQALASQNFKCTISDLKRKKESLMATFRPIWRKYKNNKKSGEIYKPNWFAFEAMSRFLTDIYKPKLTVNLEGQKDETRDSLLKEVEGDRIFESASTTEQSNIQPTRKETQSTVFSNEKELRIQAKKRKITGPLEDMYNTRKNPRDSEEKDECALYSALLAKRLRGFDEPTRQILMHNIDNLVFEARIKQFPAAPSYSGNVQVMSSTSPTNIQPQFHCNNYIVQQSPTLSSSADEASSITIVQEPKSSPTWSESSLEFKESV